MKSLIVFISLFSAAAFANQNTLVNASCANIDLGNYTCKTSDENLTLPYKVEQAKSAANLEGAQELFIAPTGYFSGSDNSYYFHFLCGSGLTEETLGSVILKSTVSASKEYMSQDDLWYRLEKNVPGLEVEQHTSLTVINPGKFKLVDNRVNHFYNASEGRTLDCELNSAK